VSKETIEAIALWANIATLIALILNVAALVFAGYQLKIGRRGTSASALITLNESFRQAWLHFSNVDEDGKQHAFADIMNLLESACAIFEDGMLIGKGGRLLEDYLCHVFTLIQQSDDARIRIEMMMATDKTFEYIVAFLESHRKKIGGITIQTQPA
jgi:hypothetical protein